MRVPANEIRTMGVLAGEWAGRGREAVVLGATSKGIYLRFPGDWVAFLTSAQDRSPFTINTLNERNGELRLGDRVRVAPHGWEEKVWIPPQFQPNDVSLTLLRQRAFNLAREASQEKSQEGLIPFIPFLGGISADFPQDNAHSHKIAMVIRQDVHRPAWPNGSFELPSLLGLGRGLTPSGDDFTAGFLLAAVRLFHAEEKPGFAEGIESLLLAARAKTTHLSATMLHGAARGWADERLIAMTDSLAAASADFAVVVAGLRTYGSTSGLDALAGCLAATRVFTK